MTQKEIAEFFGYSTNSQVSQACAKARRDGRIADGKTRRGPNVKSDYTLDEAMAICDYLDVNEVQRGLLQDCFIKRDVEYVVRKDNLVDGMEKFIERFEKDPYHNKCCDTCLYIQGRTITHKSHLPHPYCSFHKRYLATVRVEKWGKMRPVNIFTDKCDCYVMSKKPYVFYKKI